MSDRILLATFAHEDDLLRATSTLREHGVRLIDAYTPFAVHGLEHAMGWKPSRLTWVCFVFGMAGALSMLWFEHWTAATAWPIDVGGKPWNSLPSDVPVAFEAGVLLAGLATVFALFVVCRLYPGKQADIAAIGATDDRFVLAIDEADSAYDPIWVNQVLQECAALETEERIVGDAV